MTISVIIPTRNRASSLEQSLAALSRQVDVPEFEVIVIDNGSSDTTPEILAQPPAQLHVVPLREEVPNRALARNRGIAVAQGSILVFIDDDVLVPPHFLRAHFDAHLRPGAASGRVVAGPILNIAIPDDRPKPSWLNQSRAFFCTCNASVPTAAVRAVGAFDIGFTGYGWEDTDLGVRLRHYGLERYFAWQAYAYHVKPQGWESFAAATRRMQEKGHMARRFVHKYGDLRIRLATGDYALNHLRGKIFGAPWTLPFAQRLAQAEQAPVLLRSLARSHYLDAIYRAALNGQEEQTL